MVGIGAIKYADLSGNRQSDYVFSWDNMLALVGNTAPYLLYAYTRIRSIFRKLEGESIEPPASFSLGQAEEVALAKHLLRFGLVLEQVIDECRPTFCNYPYELAGFFGSFDENCPVLLAEGEVRAQRLALCDLAGRVLKTGLETLGLETTDGCEPCPRGENGWRFPLDSYRGSPRTQPPRHSVCIPRDKLVVVTGVSGSAACWRSIYFSPRASAASTSTMPGSLWSRCRGRMSTPSTAAADGQHRAAHPAGRRQVPSPPSRKFTISSVCFSPSRHLLPGLPTGAGTDARLVSPRPAGRSKRRPATLPPAHSQPSVFTRSRRMGRPYGQTSTG